MILLGLSNSGKTSCLNVLRHQPAQMVVPTVGYSIEDFETKGAKIRAVDLSGWWFMSPCPGHSNAIANMQQSHPVYYTAVNSIQQRAVGVLAPWVKALPPG